MPRKGPNLSLFPDEKPVKAESRKERRAKQEHPVRSGKTTTMRELWKNRSSFETKCIHWNTSGPFGGSTTHAACGKAFGEGVEKAVLVQHVTCFECQLKASQAWAAMARHSRGLE